MPSRALGEYGSVIFISGNLPMKTEIAPLLIVTKLEQYDYPGATAIAAVLLITSFLLLLAINMLQRRTHQIHGGSEPEAGPGWVRWGLTFWLYSRWAC